MLSRETVVFQLGSIAGLMRRKVEAKVYDAYHRALAGKLDEDQFVQACVSVVEEDDKFPSVARLLALGRTHRKWERGVATLYGEPLSAVFSDLDSGRQVGGDTFWRGRAPNVTPMIERIVYEGATAEVGARAGETTIERLTRIVAMAEAEIAKLNGPAAPPAEK